MQKLDFTFDGGVVDGTTKDRQGKAVPTRSRSVVRGEVIVGERDVRIRQDGSDKETVVARLEGGELVVAGFTAAAERARKATAARNKTGD